MRIFIPAGILAVLIGAYSWFWFHSAGRIEDEFNRWVAFQRTEGLIVTYDGAEVSGYPLRLQLRVTAPQITETKTDGSEHIWTGSALTAHALPYKLNHIIVVAEGDQSFILRQQIDDGVLEQRFDGRATSARASLVFSGGVLERVAIDLQGFAGKRDMHLENATGFAGRHSEDFKADRLQFHSIRSDQGSSAPGAPSDMPETVRRVALRAQNVTWSNHQVPALGEVMNNAEIRLAFSEVPEATMATFGPFATETLRLWQGRGGKMWIEDFTLNWAPLNVTAKGALALDQNGFALGSVDIASREPGRVVDALQEARMLSKGMADATRPTLRVLMALDGRDEDMITVPVHFRKGGAYISSVRVADTSSAFE